MQDIETVTPQRTVVAGSRDIDDQSVVLDVLNTNKWEFDGLMHGGADGIDALVAEHGSRFADTVVAHPVPDWVWAEIGRKAGPMRNRYMAEQADALIAIWDGQSSGTKNMLKLAEANGLLVRRVVCESTVTGWEIESDDYYGRGDQSQLGDF
jgi:hypothetical protein